MDVARARHEDISEIEALLTGSALPLDGAAAAFETGVVARFEGALLGAAAIEPFGDAGLLRSVVVTSGERGTGIGRALVAGSERLARELGIDQLYLLTDTAESWFHHLGYETIGRDAVPATVRESIEFTTACSDTAVAMTRRIS